MSTVHEAWICIDCGMYHYNGDLSGNYREGQELETWLETVATNLSHEYLALGDSDKDREFSKQQCESCGSRLGGYRYHAYIMEEG